MTKQKLQPTSASAYRQSLAEAVTLPSGNVFLLRKVSMQTYLKNGRLPEHLFSKIQGKWESIQNLSESEAGLEIAKDFNQTDLEKILLFQADVVQESCQMPKLVLDCDGSKDDELNPNELSQEDFAFIFNWAINRGGEGVQSLGNFRGKRK